jgi:hypothetical protein
MLMMVCLVISVATLLLGLGSVAAETTYSLLNTEFLDELDWQRSLFVDLTTNPLALNVQVNYNRVTSVQRNLLAIRTRTEIPSAFFTSFNLYLDSACSDLAFSTSMQLDTCMHVGFGGGNETHIMNELVDVIDSGPISGGKFMLAQSYYSQRCGGVPQSVVMGELMS